ncbi:histidine phosphatase family protein [Rhodobacterales bacterium 52_120_T64]|nr:histidine phosphatase family protein [Rhodobacterales bacterium 52_120_T64]
MSTRLWFVRHGPTHSKAAVGWSDVPADLSDLAALRRLSSYLPVEAKIISSDLKRASATADALQGGRVRLQNMSALREMNFGDWDGRLFADIAKSDPETSRQFWESPGAVAPPNGESWDDLSMRIAAAVDTIITNNGTGDVVIVGHFAAILTALQRASGMSAKAAFAFKIDNLSVTRLEYLHPVKSWRVHGVNHLP